MKMKRGKDRHWKVVKYIGDGAYYATCKCGYEYGCGSCLHKEDPWVLYRYCPNCGARKKWYNDEVIKTGIPIEEHLMRCV